MNTKLEIKKLISAFTVVCLIAPPASYSEQLTLLGNQPVAVIAPDNQTAPEQPAQVQLQSRADAFENQEPIFTPASINVFHVNQGESIQAAINLAQAGDTVLIHVGTYHETITLKQGVNLKGENRDATILDGQAQFRDVILANGNNIIENVTVKGGAPYNGQPQSAIRIEGDNVTVKECILRDNASYAVYVRAGENVLIQDNLFVNNELGVQLPKNTTTIRRNTFVNQSIAVNILGGMTPRVEYNIFSGSRHSSIYEFAAGRVPSRGYAVVENNVFWNNQERGSFYGSATPPSVENKTQGNFSTNPLLNPDYTVPSHSPAYEYGWFAVPHLPQGWTRAASNPSFAFQSLYERVGALTR